MGPLKQTKHPRIGGFTCLEGSGRLNVSYFTCLEAQNVDKYITFARFSGWNAPGIKITCILRVWKALGGLKCRILSVWKLKTSKNTSHLLGFWTKKEFESNPDPWFFSGSGPLLST